MEALYRKYRPSTFADVVGQEHIERTLKNAIEIRSPTPICSAVRVVLAKQPLRAFLPRP